LGMLAALVVGSMVGSQLHTVKQLILMTRCKSLTSEHVHLSASESMESHLEDAGHCSAKDQFRSR
jgi:hypothetical protein